MPQALADTSNELTELMRRMVTDMYERLVALEEQIARYDNTIRQVHLTSEMSRRLGQMIATAVLASAGDAKEFRNGQQFAAWLGLVPKQFSSGGKQKLLGITKRGNGYLRILLVHGARAVVQQAAHRQDLLSQWINKVRERRGINVAVLALANKTARTIWAMLARGEGYRLAA